MLGEVNGIPQKKSKNPYKLGPKVNYLIWSLVIIHLYSENLCFKEAKLYFHKKEETKRKQTWLNVGLLCNREHLSP